MDLEYAAATVAGYLLGSIPVALLVARRHGVDLYATGDGNPGAWNALEQLGAAPRLAGVRRRRAEGPRRRARSAWRSATCGPPTSRSPPR